MTRLPAIDGVVDLPGDGQPGDDTLDAVTHGVLASDAEGCVWLTDEAEADEPVEPETSLIWPADYSFDTSTQQILDPAGETVASIGDRVALGGGETPHRTPEWCAVADRVWSVASIEREGDGSPDGPDAEATRETMGDYEQITLDGARLWAHAASGDGSGEGAEVVGVLGFDAGGSCLYLEQDGVRFPVVWPYGTELLDDDPVRVGLRDGLELRMGTRVEGGGGYHQADLFDFEIPEPCVSSTGEVAHFNQQSAIQISK